MVCRTIGVSDQWCVGPMVCRTNGVSDQWCVGPMVSHRLGYRPPHLTETCVRVELMVSQRRRQRANIKETFFEKLMNIQYLNLPTPIGEWYG